ncbi:hypothetical protein SMICM304S_04474 [Streptomyces microflavus]
MAEEKKRTRQPNGASSIYLGADGKWHGRVTVGVRADGKPDRRHIERKTRPEVTEAVRELERQRKDGKVRKAGQQWTVKTWLEHWVQNIAKKYVSENSYDGYEVDVRVHLVPGLGAHKLEARSGSVVSARMTTRCCCHSLKSPRVPRQGCSCATSFRSLLGCWKTSVYTIRSPAGGRMLCVRCSVSGSRIGTPSGVSTVARRWEESAASQTGS